MMNRTILALVAVLISAAFGACSHGDPLDDKADAGTAHDFAIWQQRESDRLTSQQADALTTAIGELKLKAQAHGAKADAIDDDARKEINGKSVREILQLGYSWKLATLDEQRSYIDSFLKQNAELKTKPGDTASADYLTSRRDEQTSQLHSLDAQIAELTQQMKELGLKPEPAKLPPKPADDATGTATPSTPGAADTNG